MAMAAPSVFIKCRAFILEPSLYPFVDIVGGDGATRSPPLKKSSAAPSRKPRGGARASLARYFRSTPSKTCAPNGLIL
jgi:hypothetical protein